jgi:hypothetical protein
VDPHTDSKFPGTETIRSLFAKAKGWLSPTAPLVSSPDERRPLLGTGRGSTVSVAEQTETTSDDEAYASSSDFPNGYAAHYATLPSVDEQKFVRERKKLVLRGVSGAFVASILLMAVAGILVATGRHKLRVEVDAGVFTGVTASLFFATMGFAGMLYEHERIGAIYRWAVGLGFVVICAINSFIMAMVTTNTRL